MMKHVIKYFLLVASSFLWIACASSVMKISVSNDIINHGYIGNGVEWDPYDEAESWGTAISDSDWETLFNRLDYMRPPYIRCMINSPYRYYDKSNGKYDRLRHLGSIVRLLKYCTERGISVVFGEYNPPTFEMKQDQKWIDMSVDYLNYLVNDLHLTCIKYFVIFNEPDGNWAATDGDYILWKDMLFRFYKKMKEYPGLVEKVKFAGPDVVAEYRNPHSDKDTEGWIRQTVTDADSIIGLYDVHAYPGQFEVRHGDYVSLLDKYRKHIPQGKKIVLGEAGYKYSSKEDASLIAESKRRLVNHPFTKGSDCNMLCYDYFYGLDIPLLAMKVMNAGFSGMAMWMLDDAMHSNGDSGVPKDIKVWGLWNILGKEVFGKPDEENIRPCFYSWSLMCRYFPAMTDILRIETTDGEEDVYAVAGKYQDKLSVAIVNFGVKDKMLQIKLPFAMNHVKQFSYSKDSMAVDENHFPVPSFNYEKPISEFKGKLKAQSFMLLTNVE
jgi:hypothetical protein